MIFNLPEKQSEDACNLINHQVRQDRPLNLGLIFGKYANKFVTGHFTDQRWNEGKQSEIKRQIYLLKKSRVEILEKLQRQSSQNLREISKIVQLLKNSDIDGSIDELSRAIRKFGDRRLSEELRRCVEELSKIKLSISLSLIDCNLLQTYHKRADNLLNNLRLRGYSYEREDLQLNWRLAINLGTASVYETSLLFHRNYSIPYIPGSAVKGVTRHWAILKIFEEAKCENWEEISCVEKILENASEEDVKLPLEKFQEKYMVKEDKKKIKPSEKLYYFFKQKYKKIKEPQEIFGTQGKKGEVIFFDALPIIEQKNDFIVLDVMNVHYKPYYEASERELKEKKEKAPGDWHSPVPIFFLAVEKETKFRFCVASKNSKLAEKAIELLKEAVKKIGIGAKTSAGYGYFK